MAKIILLSGSPNPEGNTVQVLRECAKAVRAHGAEAELLTLAGMDLRDVMDAGRDDGFDAVIEKIRGAQGLIVGAPVYWGTARAELMTALQRLAAVSARQGHFLSRMVGGPIAVARRGGLTSSLQEMLMFYLANDMIVAGSTYWNIVFGRTPGQAMEDAEGLETIRRFGENVAYVAGKLYGA